MLLVASAASAMKLPDPVITVTEGEEYYTVDVAVEGDYELRVFCGNLEIETPYAIERLDVDKEYIILAFAQLYNEEGWSYSNVVEYDLYVPAKEEMPVPGPYPPGWIYFDVIEGDEYYTVLAYCEEDGFTVQLWSNGEPVDNPYIIERSPEGDMEYVITACSQAEGYDIVTATMTLVVPGFSPILPARILFPYLLKMVCRHLQQPRLRRRTPRTLWSGSGTCRRSRSAGTRFQRAEQCSRSAA